MSDTFILPGAEELLAFQDLIDGGEDSIPDVMGAPAPGACAYRLCGMLSAPRSMPEDLSDEDALEECVGFLPDMNPDQKQVSLLLERLLLFLENEVQYAPSSSPESPHLSVLPLFGAWWAGSRFTARVRLFSPDSGYHAAVVLMDEEEHTLSSVSVFSHAPASVLEAPLPEEPCMLHLGLSLFQEDKCIEYRRIPVPVGERGPLEFAYSAPASILIDKSL